ncbi:MAG: DNA polymerase III subunit delta [Actinobacteria bacterium]|nr:DNA polymerase III subunit delta [Actinomycetota bacterium]
MSHVVDRRAPVHLIKGDDPILIADAIHAVVEELVGAGDRGLMLEELDAGSYDAEGDRNLGALVDAAGTPPFLTDRRVVVGRQLGAFTKAADVAGLVQYLAEPLPTTSLVLGWEPHPSPSVRSGAPPKKLVDAIRAANGVVIDTAAGTGKAYSTWLDAQLKGAPVVLDGPARKLVAEQIGEDASRIVGLLPVLESVFGAGARLGVAEIGPYIGDEGSVKPWDLTDAIDRGDAPTALNKLHRMMGSGMHPLQIMASLTNHFLRMVALDGSGADDERSAAEVLGLRGSTFPARKALAQSRTLGPGRLRELFRLLAKADLDLRGATALPNDLVMEVLVARLASRSRR